VPWPAAKIVVAMNIMEKKVMNLGQLLESFGEIQGDHLVSDSEWAVLSMTNA